MQWCMMCKLAQLRNYPDPYHDAMYSLRATFVQHNSHSSDRIFQCLAVVAVVKSEGDIAQSRAAKAQPTQEKPPVAAKPVAQMEHVEEAKRLLSERSSLLKTGSYSKESAVIQQLDAKIQELGNKALGTWNPPS